MAERAITLYLNDHLAGGTAGRDLAGHIRDHYEGTSVGAEMTVVADEIDADHKTLTDLMERLGAPADPIKQTFGWLAEKAGGLKFAGILSGSPEQGAYMALESLVLGIEGKICMWKALKQVEDRYPSLSTTRLDELIERGERQKAVVERQRIAHAQELLSPAEESAPFNPYSEDRPPSRDDWTATVGR